MAEPFQPWLYHCHLHPLQAANCCRNSRLVVDKMIQCGLKINENYHVLVNQFHGNIHSKTLGSRKTKSVFRDVKLCFNASWGLKGLMAVQLFRPWPNIKPVLAQRLVFADLATQKRWDVEPMLFKCWPIVYDAWPTFNSYSVGIDFSRQNLTSVDVRFWRLKSIPAL